MPEPVDAALFASLQPLALAGSRCTACGTLQFPPAQQCAHCAAEDPEPVALPTSGRIWTWTIQRFAPKPPYVPPATGFVPYAVGYVDLGEVLVETRLRLGDADPVIGSEVHLVSEPVAGERFTYAFSA